MKYLATITLFLLSNNLLAAMKYEITNNVNGRSYGAVFEDDAKGEEWKQKQIAKNSWGKPDRWELKKDGEVCGEERQVGDIVNGFITECHHSVQYTITETDVTVEEQAKKDKKVADRDTLQSIRQKLIDNVKLSSDDMEAYIRIREGL